MARGKAGRRAKGEGSIFYREDKKLWTLNVTVGYESNGKQKRKTLYAKTQDELIQKKRELEASIVTGNYVEPNKTTVAQYLESWLTDAYKATVRPSTYIRNEGIIRNHVIPALGMTALPKLTPLQLQNLYGLKLAQGQSPRSIRNMHFVIHKALKQAARWGYVVRNVADLVDLPKVHRQEVTVLSPEQIARFIREAKEERYYPLYVMALTTGLRQGELLGLQWSDCDLDAGTVMVRRTLKELNGRMILGEPKSKNARRTVMLPKGTILVMREHRKAQLERGFIGAQYVFTDRNGGPVRPQNMVRRSFHPLLRQLGLPEIRFHDLRHSHATLLLQQGVNPKLVQERLGHSTINLTLDTYSHVLPNMQDQVAARINELYEHK